jgi:hypothetical protein
MKFTEFSGKYTQF